MINFDEIKSFFADNLRRNPSHFEYMLKEYFHYRILDILFSGQYASKLSFIGGTSLRILHHIQRFSEDLDFDCFQLSREEFIQLSDKVIAKLRKEGIRIEAEDKEKDLELVAFRRNLIFPGLLYELGLTAHREKKLLFKIECEPHHYAYEPTKPIIQKFNVFTQIFAPSTAILLSMKTGAVMERGKGRDFYDFIFLSGLTEPDFGYLKEKFGITNQTQLYERILESCETTDFELKSKDFEKLVNIEEPLEMEDDLMLKADKIYVANLPVELPLKTGQELGNMSVLAGGTPQIEMKLVSRDETSNPFIYQEINIEKNNNFKNLLIFLIAFYFLVFIFIIIKNLILKKRGDRYE